MIRQHLDIIKELSLAKFLTCVATNIIAATLHWFLSLLVFDVKTMIISGKAGETSSGVSIGKTEEPGASQDGINHKNICNCNEVYADS